MASKLAKGTTLRAIPGIRGYAAAAKAASAPQYIIGKGDLTVGKASNGAAVATQENNAPISKIALLFKAGSRYETAATRGAAHILRQSAGLGTDSRSAYGIVRGLQQCGASLTVDTGREHAMYSVAVSRDNVGDALTILGDIVSEPSFKPWELSDNLSRVKLDLATQSPASKTLELLHSVAYRGQGLGNSIFVAPHLVGKVGHDQMAAFYAATHTAGSMAAMGVNVDPSVLSGFAGALGVAAGAGAANAGAYGGGEVRVENAAGLTCVAVAGEGGSIGSGDAAALAVAAQLYGIGSGIKYGANSSSAAARALVGQPGAAVALNVNYSDSGLFGLFVLAESGSIGEITRTAMGALRSLPINEDTVAHGKKMAKAAVFLNSESEVESMEELGLSLLLTGAPSGAAAAAAAIDAVSVADVQKAVSKALNGKLSMAAIGSVDAVPYLDAL